MELFASFEILFIIAAFVIILTGAVINRYFLVMAGVVTALWFASDDSVNELTANILGFGASWIVIGVVGIIAIAYFRLHPYRIFFLRMLRYDFLMVGAFLYIMTISILVSPNPHEAVMRTLGYIFVYVIGVKVIGEAIARKGYNAQEVIYRIVTILAVVQIIYVAIVFTIAYERVFSPERATFILAGVGLSRLADVTVVGPVGLAGASSLALFVTYRWFARARHFTWRLVAIILLLGLSSALVLSGSRGAILATVTTILVLVALRLMYVKKGGKLTFLFLSLGIVAIVLEGRDLFMEFVSRGKDYYSLFDVIYQSRYQVATETYRNIGCVGILIGTGAGSSFLYPDKLNLPSHIESFWLQLLLEWGLIGSLLYLSVLIIMTWNVCKMDIIYLKQKYDGSWLPLSWFIFIWITSPFYFGFSVFTGKHAVLFGIGAAAIKWNLFRNRIQRLSRT